MVSRPRSARMRNAAVVIMEGSRCQISLAMPIVTYTSVGAGAGGTLSRFASRTDSPAEQERCNVCAALRGAQRPFAPRTKNGFVTVKWSAKVSVTGIVRPGATLVDGDMHIR